LKRLHVQLAGPDACRRNTVIDQCEQLRAGGVKLLKVGYVSIQSEIFRFLLQHLTVTNDLVKWCAEIVSDVGKRGILTGIRFLAAQFGAARGCPRSKIPSCFGVFAGHVAPLLCNKASIFASNFGKSTGLVS